MRPEQPIRAAALSLLIAAALGCADSGRLQGAVLIVLDTLRADRLSAYGHPRQTSPVLDGLAARGVLFEQAISSSSWTHPAMISLLSGRYATAKTYSRRLNTSLVETLLAAGYETAAFTEGGYVSAFFGFDRGFRSFDEAEGPVRLYVGGRTVTEKGGGIEQTFDRARAWLREHANRRFFLLVHTYEVHAPYRRRVFTDGAARGSLSETFEERDMERVRDGSLAMGETEKDYLGRLYDGGVATADRYVGMLLDRLEELGIAEATLVVVTSDHGEELGHRHARFAGDHGYTLYDEAVRVPLILFDPRDANPGRRIRTQVRTIDVMPTVLDLLGVPPPADADGRSLVPILRGEETEHRSALIRLFPKGRGRVPTRAALRDGKHKIVSNLPFIEPAAPRLEIFDLRSDPGERQNLVDEAPEVGAEMAERLEAQVQVLREAGYPDLRPPLDLPDALRQRLESLGYLR